MPVNIKNYIKHIAAEKSGVKRNRGHNKIKGMIYPKQKSLNGMGNCTFLS